MAKELTKRKEGGRPAYQPTDENRQQVEAMAGFGIPHDDIRLMVLNPTTGQPIAKRTLERAFRTELKRGVIKANSKVAESVFNMAIGRVGMMIRTVDEDGIVIGEELATLPVKPVPGCAIFWCSRRLPGWKDERPVSPGETGEGAQLPPLRFTLNLADVPIEDAP